MFVFTEDDRAVVEYFAPRVRKGIAYLNEVHPNWLNEVNPSRLDMGHGENCILGQLEGAFWTYLENYGRTPKFAKDHGFNIPIEWTEALYEVLTLLWVNEIEALRAGS
jgi:hypothetical protein